MVVDSSALVAMLRKEPGHEALRVTLAASPRAVISAPTLLEVSMVMYSKDETNGIGDLDELLRSARIDTVAVGQPLALAARDAFVRYGKGIHPAGLNFGDCFSYALATSRDEPLLFTGADFAQTDVKVAAPPADWKPLAGDAS